MSRKPKLIITKKRLNPAKFTKNIKLALENNGIIKDPLGNIRVGLELSGQLNRKDYGITWNTVLEASGVAVGEMVKLDIQVEGILAH